METILVLTNFSRSARNAAEAALALASKLGTNVLLLHTFVAKPLVSINHISDWPFGDMPLTEEESLSYLKEELFYLQNKVHDQVNLLHKPEISFVQKEGSLANNINKLQREKNIKLIFMGGGQHEFLFGNHVRSLIDEISCLLMIIPFDSGRLDYDNVCFATDLNKEDLIRMKFLSKYLYPLSTKFHVCHVSVPNFIPDIIEEDLEPAFKKGLDELNSPFISYHSLEGDEVMESLEQFNKEINADILVLAHKSHGLFWRIFNQDLSDMLLKDQKTPLLIMP